MQSKKVIKTKETDQSVILSHGKTPKKAINSKTIKRKSKYHALDIYIIFCFVCIILYTIVHTIIFYQTGSEASVLDALFYGVFGGEVLLCALLKRLKLKQEHEQQMKSKEREEDEYEVDN